MTRGDTARTDGGGPSTVELMSRVVAGIQDLAWQGLLSEQDAMMFTARVRQLAAAVESGAEPGCVPMEN